MSSVEITTVSRGALRALIKRESTRVGSLTLAHENIAKAIGMSSSWIRKFIADDGGVREPRLTLHFRIVAAFYDRVCNRVEQEQKTELAEIVRLRRKIDAVTASFIEMATATAGADESRTETESIS